MKGPGFAAIPSSTLEPESPPSPAVDRRTHDATRPPLLIGVLGGIASGKSLAARLLAGSTGITIDADALAGEALAAPDVVVRVRERFGEEAIGPDGRVVREFLAQRVFADAEDRKALEAWTHPLIRARILASIADARAAGRSPIVLDVPLLVENDAEHGLARACDVLVFVDADDAERERRARTTRGWQAGELGRREAAQLSLAEKERRADYVISNRTNLADFEAATASLRRTLGFD